MGATTVWERWNSVEPDGKISGTEMNSLNHYSYGSIVEWMFRNMAGSLVRHEIIKTTLPKAKELRRVVEPLITLAKTDSVANRRLAFARTRDNEIVAKLFNELGPRFASRAGGYTRILKCGFRAGDNAPMAYIELVDRSEKAEAAAE